MPPSLGELMPNFEAETTIGKIKFHDWLGDSWGILFSHPSDFTPVCTTELARLAQLHEEFNKRGVKLIGLSCDSVEDHLQWAKDVMCYAKLSPSGDLPFPMIGDSERTIATKLGAFDPDAKNAKGEPKTCRSVFVVGPDKKLKLSILYPAVTGRNFSEILRVVDSLQLTAGSKLATPVEWKVGDDCIVFPNVKMEDARQMFPLGVNVVPLPSGKEYLRTTPYPK